MTCRNLCRVPRGLRPANGNTAPGETAYVEPSPVDAWTLAGFAMVAFIAVTSWLLGFGGWL